MLNKENFDDLFCELVKSLMSCRQAIDRGHSGSAERHLNQAKWTMEQVKYLMASPPKLESGE